MSIWRRFAPSTVKRLDGKLWEFRFRAEGKIAIGVCVSAGGGAERLCEEVAQDAAPGARD